MKIDELIHKRLQNTDSEHHLNTDSEEVHTKHESLWLFQIFTGFWFQIKLHLQSIVLLSGFQSSPTELDSTW